MNSATEERQTDIVRLTEAALEAAEQGRWDAVIQCYRDRGALLEAIPAPVRGADDLLKLDETIRERANTVQAVLTSVLGEAMATRQRLQELRHRLGTLSSAPGTVSVEA